MNYPCDSTEQKSLYEIFLAEKEKNLKSGFSRRRENLQTEKNNLIEDSQKNSNSKIFSSNENLNKIDNSRNAMHLSDLKDEHWNIENYFNFQNNQMSEMSGMSYFTNIGIFHIKNNSSNLKKYFNVMHRRIKISDNNIIDNFFFTDVSRVINFKIKQIQESIQRQRMFAKISHEFKTPLNSIIGMISHILNPSENKNIIPKQTQDDLKVVSNLSNYVIFLISDIIQYTDNTIKSTEMKININFINFKDLMDFCFQILNSLLFCNINKKEKIKTSMIFDESLEFLKILSDELRIKQILLNLISNAVKFTNEGEIKLKCKKSFLNEQYYVKISISDSGKGIREEDKIKLFNDFVMLEPSKADNKFGSGLGLSICKSIAEKMNIILDFKTNYGKGSKFFIYVPINFEKGKNDESIDKYDSSIMNEKLENDSVIQSVILNSKCNKNNFNKIDKINNMDNYSNDFNIKFKNENHRKNKNMFDLRTISDNFQRKICSIVNKKFKLNRNYFKIIYNINIILEPKKK